MQDHYSLLHTIYEIVKNDPQPERYSCKPRELILRRMQEWSDIQQQIHQLERELVTTGFQRETAGYPDYRYQGSHWSKNN